MAIRLVLKVSSAFQQERLLKDENRRRLQDALKERHPALELGIAWDAKSPEQSSSHIEVRGSAPGAGGRKKQKREQRPKAERSLEGAASPGRPASGCRHPTTEVGRLQRAPSRCVQNAGGTGRKLQIQEVSASRIPGRHVARFGQRGTSRQWVSKLPWDGKRAEQRTAPGHQPGNESTKARSDPVVGVALTLFNGKIIDETEAG